MGIVIAVAVAALIGLAIVGFVAWLSWLEQEREMTAYLRRMMLRKGLG